MLMSSNESGFMYKLWMYFTSPPSVISIIFLQQIFLTNSGKLQVTKHYAVMFQPALACSILGPNIIPSVLSSNITDLNWTVFIIYHVLNWSLCCIFHARGQISHPCKSICNNLEQNTLSLVSRQQERRHRYCEQNGSRNCLLSILLQFLHKHNFCYCHTQTELYF